ncbi:MAG: hypothetical protein KKE02_01615 [Alphaproteobacteria bacterium]|nr:hypothetical protein [Alphaproteobacteria bacterium]MBU1516142.1 hypothetical protein [Alphaproteobacteria bacterium]MBU2092643.1 hypothetical protein [Alphaproteobacteria bacterium]MBU2149688.1 hypothetical protein [Alphaproteobacteria bacterium]MBU2308460.1 hypothetical protein [Alphaproteobacteria bacterium]
MKPALFLATAALTLTTVPALADNGQRFDAKAQMQAYSSADPIAPGKQCFNGRQITGVNRAGDKTIYVQARQGAIYALRLRASCAPLNAAETLTLRANGGDTICPGSAVELIAQTAAGPQRCAASDVRALTFREINRLSVTAQR